LLDAPKPLQNSIFHGGSGHFGPFAADLATVGSFAGLRIKKHCKIRRFLRPFPFKTPFNKPGSQKEYPPDRRFNTNSLKFFKLGPNLFKESAPQKSQKVRNQYIKKNRRKINILGGHFWKIQNLIYWYDILM